MIESPVIFDKLLVLFGGVGLATKGLVESECAKHIVSVELDPAKHHLSQILNPTVEHIEADVMTLDSDWIASFDAVWSSPPCQKRSRCSTTADTSKYEGYDDLLSHSLLLPNRVLWIENVLEGKGNDNWGKKYNAAQFLQKPIQNRQRLIGGRYRNPKIYRQYEASYLKHGWNISHAVLASIYKRMKIVGEASRNNTRFGTIEMTYGYVPTIDECAWLQGIDAIPLDWYDPIEGYTEVQWRNNLYQGIGNGVPVYMSRAFGLAYSRPDVGIRQLPLFELDSL